MIYAGRLEPHTLSLSLLPLSCPFLILIAPFNPRVHTKKFNSDLLRVTWPDQAIGGETLSNYLSPFFSLILLAAAAAALESNLSFSSDIHHSG